MSQNYIQPTTDPNSSPSANEPNIRNNDDALLTSFSGNTAPALTVPGQQWLDTANQILYIRNKDNNSWVQVAQAFDYQNALSSGSHNIGTDYNGRVVWLLNYVGQPSVDLHFLDSNLYPLNFSLTVISYSDGDLNFYPAAGQQIYRNGDYVNSYTASGQSNVVYTVSKLTSGELGVMGVEKGVNSDLATLTQAGEKKILDFVHPIGSVFTANSNIAPPLQGVLGVHWTLLPEGRAVMTASSTNVGTTSGSNRLDTGNTGAHAITVSQLPSHNISFSGSISGSSTVPREYNSTPGSGYDFYGAKSLFATYAVPPPNITYPITGTCSGTAALGGSNQGHNHGLAVVNQKLMHWYRVS